VPVEKLAEKNSCHKSRDPAFLKEENDLTSSSSVHRLAFNSPHAFLGEFRTTKIDR
jgi:hypothetical protein